jgi:hypothetical protein
MGYLKVSIFQQQVKIKVNQKVHQGLILHVGPGLREMEMEGKKKGIRQRKFRITRTQSAAS